MRVKKGVKFQGHASRRPAGEPDAADYTNAGSNETKSRSRGNGKLYGSGNSKRSLKSSPFRYILGMSAPEREGEKK